MRLGATIAVAVAVGALATTAGYAVDAVASDAAPAARGPGVITVPIDIDHSHFSIDQLRVHPGTLVRFVVRNHDPIAHELVVGDAAVHARHERGSEAAHPPVPGEVSIAADDVGETFYRFDEPGTFVFACHLPRHFAYGMHGKVTVTRT